MTAARARHVQNKTSASSPLEVTQPLMRVFSALTRYSANEQPGFVLGLQRDHEPRGRNWYDDAMAAYAALQAELPPQVVKPKVFPDHALRDLRGALGAGAPAAQIAEAVGAVLD